jgi:pyruvate dehydrogenase E1 component alpha subunit
MPGRTIDGQNVTEVYRETAEAVADARANDHPVFIECETYRRHGHFSGESALFEKRDRHYRSDEEVDAWVDERDPIEPFAAALADADVLSADERSAIDDEMESRIETAVADMHDADYPQAADTMTEVYADQSYSNIPAPKYR